MKKLVLVVFGIIMLSGLVYSCEDDQTNNQLYEQGIDNDEVQEDDI